ncbi:MAG TPA: DnaA/Hda family protein [Stellaceae bacterium]|nr:DnaA/Hda family protein [Stellaceae bacterium]
MAQLTFDLSGEAALGRADFCITASNEAAAGWIDRWPAWPTPALVLHGPQGCGKTHLANLWCVRAAACRVAGPRLDESRLRQLLESGDRRIAVDDADRAGEPALLHLFNACHEDGGSLLLTARAPPALWPTMLADLASRLRGAHSVGIAQPDDALFAAVLVKHFADRQVRVSAEIIAYLGRHLDRSLAEAAAMVAALDAAALRDRVAITVPLARRVLAERAAQS